MGPNTTYQGPRSLALWFRRRRFLKGFYHISPKLSFPRPMEAPHEIWLWIGQVVLEKIFENGGRTDGCQSFRTQVISYPGHFVPTLVISYLLFGHFVPSNNHFVPRSFCTHFGHFVPRSTGYEMTIWWSIRTQVISYPFWSFYTHFGHFVPSNDGWMDGLTNGWKDGQA